MRNAVPDVELVLLTLRDAARLPRERRRRQTNYSPVVLTGWK